MLEWKTIKEHYSREEVVKEIVKYCSGRWCAFLIATEGEGSKIVRYDKGVFKPITLDNVEKFKNYMEIFPIRTVYGTIHFYKKIVVKGDVKELTNIIASEPVWDIDNKVYDWKN